MPHVAMPPARRLVARFAIASTIPVVPPLLLMMPTSPPISIVKVMILILSASAVTATIRSSDSTRRSRRTWCS